MKIHIAPSRTAVLLIVSLVALALFSFMFRIISAPSFDYTHYAGLLDPDIWYNFRQIEVMAGNYPLYNWFDPFTAYPLGKTIDWGPLFPTLTAGLAILAGASGRSAILDVAGFVPPLCAAAMVFLVFVLGRYFSDWKAGIIAAVLVAIGNISYYSKTSYGYVDHHCMEIVLGTLFVLAYVFVIRAMQKNSPYAGDRKKILRLMLFSCIPGIVLAVGIFNMPTIILFAGIVFLFTLAATFIAIHSRSEVVPLVIINLVVTAFGLAALLIVGVHLQEWGLAQYSAVQLGVYLAIAGVDLLIIGLCYIFKDNPLHLSLALLGSLIIGVILVFAFFGNLVGQVSFLVSDPSTQFSNIREMQGLDLPQAVNYYNAGLIALAGGFIAVAYRLFQKRRPELTLLLVWSLVILVLTLLYRRYDSYFAINFAILVGIGVSCSIRWAEKDIVGIFTRRKAEQDKPTSTPLAKGAESGKKKPPASREKITAPEKGSRIHWIRILVLGIMILSVSLYAVNAVNTDLRYSQNIKVLFIPNDWVDTLQWMGENTPDPGVDYFGPYVKEGYAYPPESYGVLSSWDYGHWITFIARRIPISNPFQDNLVGPGGADSFFFVDEEKAVSFMNKMGGRYVITDTEMAVAKFDGLYTWYSGESAGETFYQGFDLPVRKDPPLYQSVKTFLPAYYQTMVVRLHLFDGSEVSPDQVYYLEYSYPDGGGLPVIDRAMELSYSDALKSLENFNESAKKGTFAGIFGGKEIYPPVMIDALRHFRLIYESPGDSSSVFLDTSDQRLLSVPHVKIFEMVPGALVHGEGTITLTLRTNTGREFTYTQKSMNGTFILPYATDGPVQGVSPQGDYVLLETGEHIKVTNDDVLQGRTVK
jgi:oligosaccharyl transferase (archaeosortase A-associated)